MAKKLESDYIEWVLKLNASDADKEISKLKVSTKDLTDTNRALKKSMSELVAQGKADSDEFRNLKKVFEGNKQIISENNTKIGELETRLKKSELSAGQLARMSKKLKDEMRETSKAIHPERYAELEKELKEVEKAQKKLSNSNGTLISSFMSLDKMKTAIAGVFISIGQMITGQIVETMKKAVTSIIDFEKQNSKLAAILGSTKSEIKDLTQDAKKFGATTSYTASQVTGLQIELAKLGFKKDAIKDMTGDTLKFAKAVDTDLSSAAALAGATLRIFNLESKETGRVVSAMAIGTTNSALNFEYLNSAMSTVAPVAASFGFSIEDTVALLGSLANSGFDASSAATATRNILLNLADSSGNLAKALGKPVSNLDELVSGLKKLDAEGIDLQETLELTDKRSVAAFNTFLRGADGISELRDTVTDCQVAFDDMAEEMGDNVQGSLYILSSTLEALVLRFYESRGALKLLIDGVTKLLEGIGWCIDKFNEWGTITYSVSAYLISYYGILQITTLWQKKLGDETILYAMKVKLSTVAEKAHLLAINAKIIALGLVSAAQALFTGNIRACTATLKTLWATMLANPMTALISFVIAAGVAIYQFTKNSEESSEAMKSWDKIAKQTDEQLVSHQIKIDNLIKSIHNENLSNEIRLKKIAELKDLIPDYNAELTKEGEIINENKKSIDKYLVSLQRQIKLKAGEEEMIELQKERNALKRDKQKIESKYTKASGELELPVATNGDVLWNKIFGGETVIESYNKNIERIKEIDNLLKEIGTDLQNNQEVIQDSKIEDESLLKKYEDKRAKVQKEWKEDTEENITKKNKEIQRLNKEIDRLNNLGIAPKNKNNAKGDYQDNSRDTIKQKTDELDIKHKQRLNALDSNKYESSAHYVVEETNEIIRYHKERIEKLKGLQSVLPENEAKTHAEILKQIVDSGSAITSAESRNEDARIKITQDKYKKKLKLQDAFYKTQKTSVEMDTKYGIISQEAADLYLLTQKQADNKSQLKIEEEYLQDLQKIDIQNKETKIALEEETKDKIKNLKSEILITEANYIEALRKIELEDDSLDGLKKRHDLEIQMIKSKYDAIIKIAKAAGLDITAIEQQMNRELAISNNNYQQTVRTTTMETRGRIRDEYDNELGDLKVKLVKGEITEKKFEKKKNSMKMTMGAEYMKYASDIAGSFVDSMMQYELDSNTAKYDALIAAAEGNSEEQERLQNEKAEKELEIQKKYADVNFMIKVSTIIADTAVAAMKAYAELGPIAGPIAAGLISAMGLVQIGIANKEREKVKNATLASKASSGASKKAPEKPKVSGYSDGGYTGDGNRYEYAGVVHKGEYVVPQPEMRNSKVLDAVTMIEAIRRQRLYGTTSGSGFAEGGYTGNAVSSNSQVLLNTLELSKAVTEMKEAIALVKNIRAYVVYQDIESARDKIEKSRKPFKRNN